jgi:hypothetical protein
VRLTVVTTPVVVIVEVRIAGAVNRVVEAGRALAETASACANDMAASSRRKASRIGMDSFMGFIGSYYILEFNT